MISVVSSTSVAEQLVYQKLCVIFQSLGGSGNDSY